MRSALPRSAPKALTLAAAVTVALALPPVSPPAAAAGGQVDGVVYWDRDGDGTHDGDEPGVPGVVVLATGAVDGATRAATRTGADGAYALTGLSGDVDVEVHTGWFRTQCLSGFSGAAGCADPGQPGVGPDQAFGVNDHRIEQRVHADEGRSGMKLGLTPDWPGLGFGTYTTAQNNTVDVAAGLSRALSGCDSARRVCLPGSEVDNVVQVLNQGTQGLTGVDLVYETPENTTLTGLSFSDGFGGGGLRGARVLGAGNKPLALDGNGNLNPPATGTVHIVLDGTLDPAAATRLVARHRVTANSPYSDANDDGAPDCDVTTQAARGGQRCSSTENAPFQFHVGVTRVDQKGEADSAFCPKPSDCRDGVGSDDKTRAPDESGHLGFNVDTHATPSVKIEEYASKADAANGDADTAPGLTLDPGNATPITVRVTNTGNDPLIGVAVGHRLIDGTGGLSGLDCDAHGAQGTGPFYDHEHPLRPGASFTCEAVIPRLGSTLARHGSETTVTATGVLSESAVTDTDNFFAHTVPQPKIEIENHTTIGGPLAGDGDTAPGVGVAPGATTPVTFTVRNDGTESLTGVVVSSQLDSGLGQLDALVCDFNDDGVGDGLGPYFDNPRPFAVEASFQCAGTVPALGRNAGHADTARVEAKGAGTGATVSDGDPLYLHTSPVPAVTVDVVRDADGKSYPDAPGAEVTPDALDPVTVTVTNTGEEPLAHLLLTNTTTGGTGVLGPLQCDVDGDGDGDGTGPLFTAEKPLDVGASVRCVGTLEALGPGATHQDLTTVVAVGVTSGDSVSATRAFNARASLAPELRVQSYATALGPDEGDADRGPGLVVDGKVATSLTFAVTNTGTEDLAGVVVTHAGSDVEDAGCDVDGDGRADGPGPYFDADDRLRPGAGFTCTASLPAGSDTGHVTTTAFATGIHSGSGVAATDPFRFRAPAPHLRVTEFATADGPRGGDHDSAPGDALDPTAATPVTIQVTNDGTDPLVGVRVSNTRLAGTGVLVDLDCDVDGDGTGEGTGPFFDPESPLAVNATFTCTASLPVLGGGVRHGDESTVVATGLGSDAVVADTDRFYGTSPAVPAIDVEAYTTNDGYPDGDADTTPGVTVDALAPTPVSLRVVNTGTEPLTRVRVNNVVNSGTVALVGLTCDVDGDGTDDGDGPFFTPRAALAVGASFTCIAVAPPLGNGASHVDTSGVVATGRNSGTRTSDTDTLSLRTASVPSIDIEEVWVPPGGLVEDADTKPGPVIDPKNPSPVGFTIVNTGTEPLRDVTVSTHDGRHKLAGLWCDARSDGVVDNAGPLYTVGVPLAPGEAFYCRASSPLVDGSTPLKYASSVTAVGLGSRAVVSDSDALHGVTAGEPRVDVEEYATVDGYPAGDYDRAPGKTLDPSADTDISVTVRNTGTEPLASVTVTSLLADGSGELEELSCDINGDGRGDGAGPLFTPSKPFATGASFSCTAVLPPLGSGATHVNVVFAHGTGVGSGLPADDSDRLRARTDTQPQLDVSEVFANEAPGTDPVAPDGQPGAAVGAAPEALAQLLDPGRATGVTVRVTNIGTEPLAVVTVASTLDGLACDVNGDGAMDGAGPFFSADAPLAPGANFGCAGSVPSLLPGAQFEARTTATGVGVGSGRSTVDSGGVLTYTPAAWPKLGVVGQESSSNARVPGTRGGSPTMLTFANTGDEPLVALAVHASTGRIACDLDGDGSMDTLASHDGATPVRGAQNPLAPGDRVTCVASVDSGHADVTLTGIGATHGDAVAATVHIGT